MKNILMFCMLMTIAGCKKEPQVVDKYFIFGKAYGECGGNCATFFEVLGDKIYADSMDYYTGTYTFKSAPMATEHYALVNAMEYSMPQYLIDSPNITIGCPDCHDQGGIYIKTCIYGYTQYWNIDMDTAMQPLPIRPYVKQMLAVIDSLEEEH